MQIRVWVLEVSSEVGKEWEIRKKVQHWRAGSSAWELMGSTSHQVRTVKSKAQELCTEGSLCQFTRKDYTTVEVKTKAVLQRNILAHRRVDLMSLTSLHLQWKTTKIRCQATLRGVQTRLSLITLPISSINGGVGPCRVRILMTWLRFTTHRAGAHHAIPLHRIATVATNTSWMGKDGPSIHISSKVLVLLQVHSLPVELPPHKSSK